MLYSSSFFINYQISLSIKDLIQVLKLEHMWFWFQTRKFRIRNEVPNNDQNPNCVLTPFFFLSEPLKNLISICIPVSIPFTCL